MPGPFLFDLDGCLVDSTPVITACIDHALDAVVGHPPRGVAGLRFAVGPPLHDSFTHLLGDRAGEDGLLEACVDAYRVRYAEVAHQETLVFPGIVEVLTELGEHGTVAIVTSKPAPVARPLVDAVGLGGLVVAVHGPELDGSREPKTTTLRRALDDLGYLGAVADGAAMVGDREHDVAAGRANGTRTVGVTWGAGDRDELIGAGVDVVVDRPDVLVEVLLDG